MFDSLYIALDGKETEVQTKRFDCVLAHYRLGDCIDGATPGVRVYFDEQDQRLTRGDDPLDVVEWALGSDELAWGWRSGAGASADPLADYRL